MTFRQYFINKLVNEYMMFEEHAAAAMDQAQAAQVNAPMKERWNDDVSGYPPFMITVTWMGVKLEVTEWVKTNLPEAFYLPMLTGVMPDGSSLDDFLKG